MARFFFFLARLYQIVSSDFLQGRMPRLFDHPLESFRGVLDHFRAVRSRRIHLGPFHDDSESFPEKVVERIASNFAEQSLENGDVPRVESLATGPALILSNCRPRLAVRLKDLFDVDD